MADDVGFADPAPLGLVGFGLTTVLLSLVNAGIFGVDLEMVVIPMAIAYGGTIQLIAGVMEYRNGNRFGTTAFTSYGAFWWWFALLFLFQNNGWIPQVSTSAIGVALIMWGVFTTYMWIATFKLNWGLFAVFLALSVTFYLLGFGDFLGIGWLVVAGGYVGIATGLLALYVSLAEVVNWTWGDDVVPLGGTPYEG